MTAPVAVDVLAEQDYVDFAMGLNHGLCTGRRGLAPFSCKCGRWSLSELPERGRNGGKTLRARILGVQDRINRHYQDERAALKKSFSDLRAQGAQ